MGMTAPGRAVPGRPGTLRGYSMRQNGRLHSRLALLLTVGLLALVLAVPAALTFASSPPSVISDKTDYNPGNVVTLTGTSWQPGESVHIYVNDNEGQTWSRSADVVADGSGAFVDQFQLPTTFVAVYAVTATGASSGTATTSFTDGNLSFQLATAGQASPAPASWSVGWVRYANNTTTGTVGYSGNTKVSGNEPGIGGNQSAKPTSVSASGYTFAYWSDSATSTTALTDSEILKEGRATTRSTRTLSLPIALRRPVRSRLHLRARLSRGRTTTSLPRRAGSVISTATA